MSSNYIAAAIDFGTTFSGYAYCTKKDLESRTPNIKINKPWKTGGTDVQFLKTPTTILFNSEGEFDSFGFEAENKYAKLAIRQKHSTWYYFRRFKMLLHRTMEASHEKLSRSTKLKDETGDKSMKAMTIFSSSIKYLKDHLLSVLVERGSKKAGYRNAADNIQWVLTVPAIWDEHAKQFMREAAVEAGIKSDFLRLALEPEAASFCCQFLQNENPDSDTSLLTTGTKYMILDLGGGTADITTHGIVGDRTLKEIHAPTGGYWGGTRVDLAFEDFLISLVGAPILIRFKNENYEDYLDLHREFESTKQTVNYDRDDKFMIKIPFMLTQMFQDETGEALEKVIPQSSYKDKVEFVKGNRMVFQADSFRDFFSPCIKPILAKLKELFTMDKMKRVDTIVMVGGFSDSAVVKGALKKCFGNKKFIIPDNPSLAIMKGAVIFGHCPTAMSTRVARLTYGFSLVRKAQPGDPATLLSGGECHNAFDKLVEIGSDVTVGNITAERTYIKVRPNQTEMILMLFSSSNTDPKYVTDPKCRFVGDLSITLPPHGDEGVRVQTIYGDTEVIVYATELLTKRQVTAKFDFLKD